MKGEKPKIVAPGIEPGTFSEPHQIINDDVNEKS